MPTSQQQPPEAAPTGPPAPNPYPASIFITEKRGLTEIDREKRQKRS